MVSRDVRVPKMGMSTTEVDVVAMLVKVGDHVDPESPLLDIESEKASFTITSDIAGTVEEVLVVVDQVVEVGAVVCRIAPDD